MTTLADEDIAAALAHGTLIRGGAPQYLGPACYELRMGYVYYDLTEGDKRIDVTDLGTVLIKPGHRVVLITLEEVDIPLKIVGRVISKGSLFSVGLSPVSTYADPGFVGHLGIVTQNLSDKYIQLSVGERIAKIEFSVLSRETARPYRGQHGFQTNIWPIRHELQKTYDEIRTDPRVEKEETEAYRLLPRVTADALRHVQRRQRLVDWAIIFAVFVNAVVLALVSTKFIDTTISLATNLIATTIVGCFTLITRRNY
jgi:dCTP deaminase